MTAEKSTTTSGNALRPAAWALFISACLAFLLVRFLILSSAIDHVHNVDEAEYEFAQQAHNYLQNGFISIPFNHNFWGAKVTIAALVPLIRAGLYETYAVKLLALLFSFAGFASLVFLLAWRSNLWATAFVALLMIFPDLNYLSWTMTLWGAYPEACGLMCVAILLWVWTTLQRRGIYSFLVGLLLGQILAFSMSVNFAAAAIAAVGLVAVAQKQRWTRLAWLTAGMVIGFLPWIWGVAGFRNEFFEPGALGNAENLPISKGLSWPELKNLEALYHRMQPVFYKNLYEPALTLLALLGLTLQELRRQRTYRDRWRLVFPATFFCAALILSMCTFTYYLDDRHLLWFYPAGYACLALLLGEDVLFAGAKPGTRRTGIQAERIIKVALFAALLVLHVKDYSRLMQPGHLGLLKDFHGMDYYKNNLGRIYGDEARNINCLLKNKAARLQDWDFHYGFMQVFPMVAVYECCFWKPETIHVVKIPPPIEHPFNADNWRGIGCAAALKINMTPADLTAIGGKYGSEALAAALAAYNECAALPCTTKPITMNP